MKSFGQACLECRQLQNCYFHMKILGFTQSFCFWNGGITKILLVISLFWSAIQESLNIGNSETQKQMEATPAIFSVRQCYDLRRKGKLHPCFQYMQSAGTVFDMLTATCHKDKKQPLLINWGLAISLHRAFQWSVFSNNRSDSDLCSE